MSESIMKMFNRIGCLSNKNKVESGYAFDINEKEVNGVTVTYHAGAMDVKWKNNEKVYREKRNARRRELYNRFREQNPDAFEARHALKREKYKNKTKANGEI